MSISASQVKELRQMTGVGMMDCKKALMETEGDLEKAVVWLREKGLSRAAKKAGRTAAEGVVLFKISDDYKTASIVELNCETDFAAKNQDFQNFAQQVIDLSLANNCKTIEQLHESKFADGKTVTESLTDLISKVGENMQLRRISHVNQSNGFIAGYSHMGGKICTLVEFEGTRDDKAVEVGSDLAMHVAACAPRFFDENSVDPKELEQEKEIAKKKLLEEGKPENMIDKIMVGQIKKFYKDVCFVEQAFVKEPKLSVAQYVKNSGCSAKLKSFVRFQLGEGIEVKKENFADEVAAQLNK